VKKQFFLLFLLEIILGLVASGAIIPVQGTSEWTVTIYGAVSKPATLNITQIMALPSSTIYAELYCYGAYVAGGNWTGVNLRFILEFVELDQNAMSLDFSATDGYNRAILLSEAMQENVIIAYELNGDPLPETLRLVLPGANGEFWVSMINQIAVSTNSVAYTYSGSGVNLQTVIPQSPIPQSSLKVAPTPTPTFSLAPTSTPEPIPSQEPTLLPESQSEELFPTFIVIAFVFIEAVVSLGLLFYFKKRKH